MTITIVAALDGVNANCPLIAAHIIGAEAADIAVIAIVAVITTIAILVAVLAIGAAFIVVGTLLLIQAAVLAFHTTPTFRAALRIVLAGSVRRAARGVPDDAFLAGFTANGFPLARFARKRAAALTIGAYTFAAGIAAFLAATMRGIPLAAFRLAGTGHPMAAGQFGPRAIANAAVGTAFAAAAVVITVVLAAVRAAARLIFRAGIRPSAALFRGCKARHAATFAIGRTDDCATTAFLPGFQTSISATVTTGRLALANALGRAALALDTPLARFAIRVAGAGFLIAAFAVGTFLRDALPLVASYANGRLKARLTLRTGGFALPRR